MHKGLETLHNLTVFKKFIFYSIYIMIFFKRYKFSIIVTLFIFYVSILKPAQLPSVPLFFGADKLIHLLMYFVLALLLNVETQRSLRVPQGTLRWLSYSKPQIFITLVFPVLFGGIIELLQKYFFAPRTGEWSDFAANTLGVLLAFFIFHKFLKNRLNRK